MRQSHPRLAEGEGAAEPGQAGVEEQRGGVAAVGAVAHRRHGVHRPVEAEPLRPHQEPRVQRRQVQQRQRPRQQRLLARDGTEKEMEIRLD